MTKPFQMMSEMEISSHLQSILQEGLNAGMNQGEIITTDKIVVDDRVLYKCMFSCSGYNANLTCPPFTMKPEETRRLLQQYSVGILYRKLDAPHSFCGPEADENKRWARISRDLQNVMADLESKAFYKGFYFALAFGGGRCRLCSLDGKCRGLENRTCIQPFMSKPPMEAVGIDVYSTLRAIDWKVSVMGKNTDPESVETAGYCGILLVY
jgi:predicted metal-binding protein